MVFGLAPTTAEQIKKDMLALQGASWLPYLQPCEIVDHGIGRVCALEHIKVWLHAVVREQLPESVAIGKLLYIVSADGGGGSTMC